MLIQKEEDMLMSFGMQSLIESSTPQIPKCDHGGLRPETEFIDLGIVAFSIRPVTERKCVLWSAF